MAEYIERETLKNEISSLTVSICGKQMFNDEAKASVLRVIDEQPTADVQEVRHGKWEQCFEDYRKQIEGDKCSVCNFEHYGTSIRHYYYCPNFGAKMDEE